MRIASGKEGLRAVQRIDYIQYRKEIEVRVSEKVELHY